MNLFSDSEDFFVPHLANKTIGYYLDKGFTENQAEMKFG